MRHTVTISIAGLRCALRPRRLPGIMSGQCATTRNGTCHRLLFAGCALLFGGAARAHPPLARPNRPTLRPVIVTAQGERQPITAVPESITVFSAGTLRALGIRSFDDYASKTPSARRPDCHPGRCITATIRAWHSRTR